MKRKLKKVAKIFFIFFMLGCIKQNVIYALSDNFKFIIDTIEIPRYNINGQEINEEVYYTYNVFSYGKPEKIKLSGQRWTSTKYGKWTKSGGAYKGKGTRGEYYIIGTNYDGEIIHNYYFPLDAIPTKTPDKWNFYNMPGAKESWNNKNNYKYIEQLNFMKETKLLFNDLSSKDKAMNPDCIKTYNISAKSIGFDKAKLDTSATWKTNGIIYTRRLIQGKIWTAIFLTPPMAANAKLDVDLDVNNEYILTSEEDNLLIPIDFAGNVVNATGYASKKHIKELNLKLYIDGKEVDNVSGSKTMSMGNKYILMVTRDKFSPNKTHSLKLLVKGYLHTEFSVDGLLQDTIEKEIKIKIEPKRVIPINNGNISVLSKDSNKWVVSPLAQTINTLSGNSQGFTEAGKYIVIKYNLNIPKEGIENLKIYLNDGLIQKDGICNKEIIKFNGNKLVVILKLPENLETTLYGWASLREKEQSYFEIEDSELLSRKLSPHSIKIKFKYDNLDYEYLVRIDTMDNYMLNINGEIKNRVVNVESLYNKEELLSWLEKN